MEDRNIFYIQNMCRMRCDEILVTGSRSEILKQFALQSWMKMNFRLFNTPLLSGKNGSSSLFETAMRLDHLG